MSSYNLTGTGIQNLSSGVGELDVTITTLAGVSRNGNANPVNRYDQGLLRLGNAFGFYPALPIDADNMVVPVPSGITRLGYKLLNGAAITVAEVFGVSPLYGGGISVAIPVPNVIGPWNRESIGVQFVANSGSFSATTAWGSANRSMLVPFQLTDTFVSTTAFVVSGSTANGNWDIGIYDNTLNLLAHTGSVAQTSSPVWNTATLAYTLYPGKYWLGFSSNSSTAVYNCLLFGAASRARAMGVRQADSNFPLATNPTLVTTPTSSQVAVFGISSVTP